MKIKDVMTPCPYKITLSKSLDEALNIMELRNIRHLPVTSADGEEILGVISKRDVEVAKFVCETTKFCPTVGDICVGEPHVVTSDTSVADVAGAMAENKLDCILITDLNGNFTGIFTTTDACRVVQLTLGDEI